MDIKKVFIIHKTHLDIGFTHSAAEVLDRYLNVYIPGAVKTAQACNAGLPAGKKNFVWTVGSFLIEYYLERGKDPAMLREAIQRGDIVWHGLPVTTHTELMDGKLMEYGLSIAQRLDQEFGRHTIAAKMTDVPSHTHAMVPYLAAAGIKYLHVGVNGSSKLVDLPPLCRLRYGDSEVVLDYAPAYGASSRFGEYAMEFAHTADNMGPPQPEDVERSMKEMAEKYPGAEIVSGTMDEFAAIVWEHRDQLPVVTEELGDTWIHGGATDPYKVGAYRELLRLRDRWEAQDPAAKDSPAWRELCRNLLMICEHTWGMDSKRWLSDYKNWDKASFREARKRNKLLREDVLPANNPLRDDTFEQYYYKNGQCSYSTIESSWEEQREYVEQAVNALPEALRQEAGEKLAALRPQTAPVCDQPTDQRKFEIAGYGVEVLEDGSVKILHTPGHACENVWLGRLAYEVYSDKTAHDNLMAYNRDFERTLVWSEGDFGKSGLATVAGLEDERFAYHVDRAQQQGDELRLWLRTEEKAGEAYGAPRLAVATYRFGESVRVRLEWFDKDDSRIPEGIFFGMNLGFTDSDRLRLTKLDRPVDPYHVREGGNRKLHGCMKVHYGDAEMESLHSLIVSVGGTHLYDENEDYGDIREGLYYLLFNNRWNTNFRLWYGENAAFDFEVKL